MEDDYGFEDAFSEWRTTLENVHLRFKDDGDVPGEQYYPHIRRHEDEPMISPEDEYDLMEKEVENTKGFDIDFSKFRCIFNYQPVDLDDNDIAWKSDTNREFLEKLSRESLEGFNEKYSTNYGFVRVIKANHHFAAGVMFFITFEAKLLSDDESKLFQAKLCYCAETADVISCELKPEKKVHSVEPPKKQDPKKPRLTPEPSNVYTGLW